MYIYIYIYISAIEISALKIYKNNYLFTYLTLKGESCTYQVVS